MAPQKFDDLGKAASDLFSKNFHAGNYKAEFNTKSSEGIDITVKGNQNAAGSLSSSVEGKFKLDCGTEVKKTWNAGGKDIDVEITKSCAKKGIKATATGAFSPDGGCALGKAKLNWSNDNLNVNLNSGLNLAPKLDLNAVYGNGDYAAGFAVGFDVKSSSLVSKAVALNVARGSVNATLKSNLGGDLTVLVRNAAAQGNYAVQAKYANSALNLAIAGDCNCQGFATNWKLDQAGVLDISRTTKLNSAVSATFSTQLNMTNLQGAGHKIGAQFKFNV